jgi:hypothetical protein
MSGVVAQLGRRGGSMGRCGGSIGQAWRLNGQVWWLNGSTPDCCPAVPGSNPASPQPTADCQSPGGLPPGMAFGCRLTSVRGDRGKNYEKELLVRQKHIKKKKSFWTEILLENKVNPVSTMLWGLWLELCRADVHHTQWQASPWNSCDYVVMLYLKTSPCIEF